MARLSRAVRRGGGSRAADIARGAARGRGPGVANGRAQALVGYPVTAGERDAFDQAAQPQPAQVVGHPARYVGFPMRDAINRVRPALQRLGGVLLELRGACLAKHRIPR